MEAIVDIRDAWTEKISNLGGKGANLARLASEGFNVPAGFIVGGDAFQKYLHTNGLTISWQDILTSGKGVGDPKKALSHFQEKIRNGEMSPHLTERITTAYRGMGGGKVAVRSSALDEDSQQASFAGQYETYLNITGEKDLIRSIIECWASLFSYRSYVYRKLEGRKDNALSIAVVVQKMVAADISGIVFTINPVSSDKTQMMVESGWGYGEGIVSGHVATDTYLVHKTDHRIISKEIRYKLLKYDTGKDGRIRATNVDEKQREISSLSDKQVREIATAASQIKAIFGVEQDIEWSMQGDTLYMLQARPVTVKQKKRDSNIICLDDQEKISSVKSGTLWSAINTGEATIGIMTPLGESFMIYYRDYLHGDCLRATGVWDTGEKHRYLGFVRGRCYLNISYIAHQFSQCPPFRDQIDFTKKFINEDFDINAYKSPFGPGAEGIKALWTGLYWLSQQWRSTLWSHANNRSTANRNKTYDEVTRADYSTFSDQDLKREVIQREINLNHSMTNYFPYYFMAMGGYDLLCKVCNRFFPDERLADVFRADMSELRTIDVTENLWRVCRKAANIPAVARIIRDYPSKEVMQALKKTPEGVFFWRAHMEPFLRKHGVRGQPPEFDLFNPRWVDNPMLLFSIAKNYMDNDFDLHAVSEKTANRRKALTDKALSTLAPMKRKFLRFAINTYYRFAKTREITRMWTMTETWVMRKLICEITRRLVEKGVLKSMDEMAFVSFGDLLDYAKGKKDISAFSRTIVEGNRRAHLLNLRVPEPPPCVLGTFDPTSHSVDIPGCDETITGLGASPGSAVGKARVIMDVDRQAGEFQPGEILVTNFTNATWTPLFVTAAAVVTDIGSMLAHSSVVAREYGIPAVVNTQVATRTIKTGDQLMVDGNQGKVWRRTDGGASPEISRAV